eukprot:g449.t1
MKPKKKPSRAMVVPVSLYNMDDEDESSSSSSSSSYSEEEDDEEDASPVEVGGGINKRLSGNLETKQHLEEKSSLQKGYFNNLFSIQTVGLSENLFGATHNSSNSSNNSNDHPISPASRLNRLEEKQEAMLQQSQNKMANSTDSSTFFPETNSSKDDSTLHALVEGIAAAAASRAAGASVEEQNRVNMEVFLSLVGDENSTKISNEYEKFMNTRFKTKESPFYLFTRYRLVHPTCSTKRLWDFLVAFLILFSIVTVPLIVCFEIESTTWLVINIFVDIFFALDIIITFRTPVLDENGDLILDAKIIAIKYLKGWFTIDFWSTVPFDLIFKLIEQSSAELRSLKLLRTLRLFRLLKMLKIVRVLKLTKLISMYRKYFIVPAVVTEFFSNTAKLLILIHVVGCLFFYTAGGDIREMGGTWIDNYDPGASDWQLRLVEKYWENDISELFNASIYWCYMTISSIGFGDILPTTDSERIFAMCIMAIGTVAFAIFISSVYALAEHQLQRDAARDRLFRITDYILENNVGSTIKNTVRNHFVSQRELNNPFYDIGEIYEALPSNLSYLLTRLTRSSDFPPLMLQLEEEFPGFLLYISQPGTVLFTSLQEADCLLEVGDTFHQIIFVVSGMLEISTLDGVLIENVLPGQTFGECIIAIPEGIPFMSKVNVFAEESSRVVIMKKDAFLNLGALCPELMKRFYQLLRPEGKLDNILEIPKQYRERVEKVPKLCDFDVKEMWSRVFSGNNPDVFGADIHDDYDHATPVRRKVRNYFYQRHTRRKMFGKYGVQRR